VSRPEHKTRLEVGYWPGAHRHPIVFLGGDPAQGAAQIPRRADFNSNGRVEAGATALIRNCRWRPSEAERRAAAAPATANGTAARRRAASLVGFLVMLHLHIAIAPVVRRLGLLLCGLSGGRAAAAVLAAARLVGWRRADLRGGGSFGGGGIVWSW